MKEIKIWDANAENGVRVVELGENEDKTAAVRDALERARINQNQAPQREHVAMEQLPGNRGANNRREAVNERQNNRRKPCGCICSCM